MEDTISIIWGIEDVKSVRPDLTDEQAREVLYKVDKHHDANYGICWDTLDTWADILYPKKSKHE